MIWLKVSAVAVWIIMGSLSIWVLLDYAKKYKMTILEFSLFSTMTMIPVVNIVLGTFIVIKKGEKNGLVRRRS